LATAVILLGLAQGLKLLESEPAVEGALITEGDQTLCTSGMTRIRDFPVTEPLKVH
jgi:thiamine biosynthesis lipoprotein ApbE